MFYLFLTVLAALVNFFGALGPELGFDALWYHLTIPKIYLMWGKIDFIGGGLLYYSAMPRLGEMLFLVGDRGAHIINWLAGIGATFITYKIARIYLNRNQGLMAALIFYATPLVGWLSGSAYVDLIRTFFEALALYLVLTQKHFLGGLAMGLAISTKTLALGSFGILGVLAKNWRFFLPALLIAAPWFIWAYIKTGYPFYPIGAGVLDSNHALGIFTWWKLWPDADPISPIFIIILPFLFFTKVPRQLLWYVILSYVAWWITPRTGGGRFLLPYLPAWSVLAAIIIQNKKLLYFSVIAVAIINISYRAVAQKKLVSYLFGQQTKEEYLCKNLDFKTEVFVDCDGWFKQNLKSSDLVLVKGFHNLYYINFPFVHETWYKNEKISYILTYRQSLALTEVYRNDLTGAKLYEVN